MVEQLLAAMINQAVMEVCKSSDCSIVMNALEQAKRQGLSLTTIAIKVEKLVDNHELSEDNISAVRDAFKQYGITFLL
jgi:hypothetical protein